MLWLNPMDNQCDQLIGVDVQGRVARGPDR
jgi:hypothetical protein